MGNLSGYATTNYLSLERELGWDDSMGGKFYVIIS